MLAVLSSCSYSVGQRVDESFRVAVPQPPTYPRGGGPTVWIDEAHNNTVATTGRYEPFVDALLADGYVVRPLEHELSADALGDLDLLVIGNPLHSSNLEDWLTIEAGELPPRPTPTLSAFSDREIDWLHRWVSEGGRLLLLTDHMPFAGAAARLAERFGFDFLDGFVEDPETWEPAEFSRSDGTLVEHPITSGLDNDRSIDLVATFEGHAFRANDAEPLMVLGPQYVSYQPEIVWDIDETTPRVPVAGWLQGAVDQVGDGRIAAFGDATMFSAQLGRDGSRLGMNGELGAGNLQLLLNVMSWLTSDLSTSTRTPASSGSDNQ